MNKKLLISLFICSATIFLTSCFGGNSNQSKTTSSEQDSNIISPSQSIQPSSQKEQTPNSKISKNTVKQSEDVEKFLLDATTAVSKIKIKSKGTKIYKVGNYDMVDIELEKSKSEIDKMMSAYFAKDLIDFELFRANILYLNNKFCSLASNFPSGYNISPNSYFEEVGSGPNMKEIQIETIPNSSENRKLLYTLSNKSGKWIVESQAGFKYFTDMYNQIYGKSKLGNNSNTNNDKEKNTNNIKSLAGEWVRQGTKDSTLIITDIKDTEFKFSLLSVNASGNTGDLSGTAIIKGDRAYHKIEAINAEIIFNLSPYQIVIEGKGNINANNGMGVTFEGNYGR